MEEKNFLLKLEMLSGGLIGRWRLSGLVISNRLGRAFTGRLIQEIVGIMSGPSMVRSSLTWPGVTGGFRFLGQDNFQVPLNTEQSERVSERVRGFPLTGSTQDQQRHLARKVQVIKGRLSMIWMHVSTISTLRDHANECEHF